MASLFESSPYTHFDYTISTQFRQLQLQRLVIKCNSMLAILNHQDSRMSEELNAGTVEPVEKTSLHIIREPPNTPSILGVLSRHMARQDSNIIIAFYPRQNKSHRPYGPFRIEGVPCT